MHMRQDLDTTREKFRQVHEELVFLRGCLHHQEKVTIEKEKESFQVPSPANVSSPVRNTICECDVNRSVVSWLKDVEHQLQFHRVSPVQWVGAAIVAFGNVPCTWFTSLPSEETAVLNRK
eukprot:237363-Hanusia_phi.AAC.1